MYAYGACVFLRGTYASGETHVRLICSKSRVAPLKTVSIPSLELCGAVLLSRLIARVYKTFDTIKINSVYLWVDSRIVLAWISSPSNKWNTFVAHRVSEIQEITTQFEWNYVPSAHNPAELISRGVEPAELKSINQWWQGPAWLAQCPTTWPKSLNKSKDSEIPELRKLVTLTTVDLNWNEVFQRFSNISRLVHTFAYVTRFLDHCKNKVRTSTETLSMNELNNSLQLILKLVQKTTFSQEIVLLKKQGSLESVRKTSIKQLNPFLDEAGLIRVGGRLRNAQIPFSQKHPILLPGHHHVTNLIIRNEHLKLLHAGNQTVLANLRVRYWPLQEKRNIKNTIINCVTCHRFKTLPLSQLMADLPEEPVVPTRPFERVGVDNAEPITIKLSTLRKPMTSKGYIAVFVYMTSKAVHLELVSDLTTTAFIAALSRFTARRGRPSLIYSDNATNFKGAQNEMKRLFDLQRENKHLQTLSDFATYNNITWKNIPPNSPSWGGLWEAAVKSVKYHLIRIMGTHKLTFEQLSTLLCKIEAVLNSRPIYAFSNDPNDFSYLSPSHFITGDYMQQLYENSYVDRNIDALKVFDRITKIRQDFWLRWSRDYLSVMQNRPKWHESQCNLTSGTLVLVREDGLTPGSWSLDRVVEVYPDADGRVRVALVKTASGTYKRAIVKLSPLPGQLTN